MIRNRDWKDPSWRAILWCLFSYHKPFGPIPCATQPKTSTMATCYEPSHPMQPLDSRPGEHKVSPVHSTASIERCQPAQPINPQPAHLKTTPDNSTADFERPTTPYAPHAYPNYPKPPVPYNPGPTHQDDYTPRRIMYTPSHVHHEWTRGSQKRVVVFMIIAGLILSLAITAIAVGLRFGFHRDRYVCRPDASNLGFGC